MTTRLSVGLLLCRGKDEVVAQYAALTGYDQPIGISDYQLSKGDSRETEISVAQRGRSGRRTGFFP